MSRWAVNMKEFPTGERCIECDAELFDNGHDGKDRCAICEAALARRYEESRPSVVDIDSARLDRQLEESTRLVGVARELGIDPACLFNGSSLLTVMRKIADAMDRKKNARL